MTASQPVAFRNQTPAEFRTQSPSFGTAHSRVVAVLDTDDVPGPRTALLPATVCQQVVDMVDKQQRCTRQQAIDFTVRLIRNYPDFKAHDAKGYVVALQELFDLYTVAVCDRATGPEGLPGKSPFIPKTADLKAALDAEAARLVRIRANAVLHEKERKRRADIAAQDAEWEASRPDEQTRARIVAGLKQCIVRIKTIPDPIPPRRMSGDEFVALGPPPYPSQAKDPEFIESLIASHDAGLAFLAERRKGKA